MGADDSGIFSFAMIALGFWLLLFLIAGGIFIYLFATQWDLNKKAKIESETNTN